MDGPIPSSNLTSQLDADETAPFRLLMPKRHFSPVLFTSSHSGRVYQAEFLSSVRLCPLDLRRSEDSFVDDLFSAAPEHGAPLLAANFPRAFCDANREPWELDPAMFTDPLPTWVNTTSTRVVAGLGTIARVVASGEPIYRAKLTFAEAERRIQTYWRPFHDTLTHLVHATKARFGYCWLIDCHSMPSNSQLRRSGGRLVDFVLGDLHGVSCASRATQFVDTFLSGQGFLVRRNDPYAGGFITAHYGRPADDIHVLQIEIARGLYMDEARIERQPGFPVIQRQITELIEALTHEVYDLIG
ncbi:N-formylglutamate amidohydrolase [Rhodopila sp.]|uniref:N-formylglutamate amidohydrolase n=1 Tax=Rhodopila sp. TaxID=2480087 RepID=UPI003D14FE71